MARRGALVQSGFAALNALVAGLGTVVVVAGAARGRFTVGDVTLFIAAAGAPPGSPSPAASGNGARWPAR